MFVEIILIIEALVAGKAGVILGARILDSLVELDFDHIPEHLVVGTGHHQLLL